MHVSTRSVRRIVAAVGLGILAVLPGVPAGAAQSADDFIGRWNIKIQESGDTFPSSWLKIETSKDSLRGFLVWKWGSVTDVEKVTVQDGGLSFRRGKEAYEAKLEDGKLHGTATMEDGKKFKFVGRRAKEMCEVAGTWKVHPLEQPYDTATITFEEEDGKITGKAVDPSGTGFDIRHAKLDGYILEFQGVQKDEPTNTASVRCEIRGDLLVGKVEMVPPGEAQKRSIEISGARERKWGEPVTLLKEQGLDGWKPRDGKKSGWSVVNGVLRNTPPDIDIMSERKFRDFKMHLEYKVDKESNSGIYLRGRYELQIYGNLGIQPHGNMAVYSRLSPARNPMKALDQWQSVDVTFIGRWVTVALNGEVVHDNAYLDGITGGAFDPWEDEPGPLLLQGDHGTVSFRNIVVTPAK